MDQVVKKTTKTSKKNTKSEDPVEKKTRKVGRPLKSLRNKRVRERLPPLPLKTLGFLTKLPRVEKITSTKARDSLTIYAKDSSKTKSQRPLRYTILTLHIFPLTSFFLTDEIFLTFATYYFNSIRFSTGPSGKTFVIDLLPRTEVIFISTLLH